VRGFAFAVAIAERQKRIVINTDLEIFYVFNVTEVKIKVHSK
jgi:hypothetical protein